MSNVSRLLTVIALATAALSNGQSYSVAQHWKVGGKGGWDYLAVDGPAHRLYVTHNTRVEVIDTKTGAVVGAISGLTNAHGVAFDSYGKKGYISDGGANVVVVFDREALTVTAKINTGTNPDSVLFEPSTHTVWAFNGKSRDVTVIDSRGQAYPSTIKLAGKPEFAQADGKGSVFVNLEDKNAIVKLDASSKSVLATWPLAGCESPSGMAIDRSAHRLFSVCDGSKMAITDYAAGKMVALASIGESPDAAGFDAKRKLAFSSNGEGTLSVVDTSRAGFPTMQTVKTAKGARTMAYDETTGDIYLSSAQYGPAPAATSDHPHPRPAVLPDSFEILVVRAAK